MNRQILFRSAWDKSDSDPKKNYGVSDLGMFFVVNDNDKFVSFEISTHWFQSHVMNRRLEALKRDVWKGEKDFLLMTWIAPTPLDVFYISPIRITEDDSEWKDGYYVFDVKTPCYYGYRYQKEENGLWTTDYLYWKLIEEGDKPIWEWLENYYKEVFGDVK